MAAKSLTFKNGKWWTCGCGGTPIEAVELPPNSYPIFMRTTAIMYGPKTGIQYQFQPHLNSIDVDRADAEAWLANGTAKPMLPGHKGQLVRTGKSNGKKPQT